MAAKRSYVQEGKKRQSQYLLSGDPYSEYRSEKKKQQKESDAADDLNGTWSLPRDSIPSGNVDTQNAVSMDRPIDSSNIGFRLLEKMGWKNGQGLGRNGTGIVDPIRIELKEDGMGLGRRELEDHFSVEATTKRKTLESETQSSESEARKKQRLDAVEKNENRKKEIAEITRSFFCEICNKQYANVAQFDEHLGSYAHHHQKRIQEMKIFARGPKQDESARKRREEREMRKFHKEAAKRVAAASGRGTPPVRAPVPAGLPPLPSFPTGPPPSFPPVPTGPPPHPSFGTVRPPFPPLPAGPPPPSASARPPFPPLPTGPPPPSVSKLPLQPPPPTRTPTSVPMPKQDGGGNGSLFEGKKVSFGLGTKPAVRFSFRKG